MSVRHIPIRLGSALVGLCLLTLSGVTFAQGEATPIQIGQNAFGELTAEVAMVQYSLSAQGGETATIQVLALTAGFAPRLRILNPTGVEILVAPNLEGKNTLVGSASFLDAGDYVIEISSANDTQGQFALSLQPGATLPNAVELDANTPITHTVGSATPLHVYEFSTTAETNLLTIRSETERTSVLVTLYDVDAGKTIATSDASLRSVAYGLPEEAHRFRVEVRASGEGDAAFTICLGACGSGQASETSETVQVIETPEVSPAACIVASGTGGSINVRSGPGTQYAIVGNLAAGGSLPVLGQLAGGGWYQVNVNGLTGWVAASVTRLDGDCGSLPTVAAPVGAQLVPTQATPTNPPLSSGGSSAPTNTPSATLMPSATPTTVQLPDLTVRIDTFWIDGYGFAHVDYTMSNIGSAPTISPFILTLCVDLTCSTYNIIENIAPGSSSSGTTTRNEWEADPLSAFPRATVTIDSGGTVAESNESNNADSAFPA